jgi:hypothetical protein
MSHTWSRFFHRKPSTSKLRDDISEGEIKEAKVELQNNLDRLSSLMEDTLAVMQNPPLLEKPKDAHSTHNK